MLIIFVSGLVGISFALLAYGMYSAGILVDEGITGTVTIINVMSFIIIISVVVGVILAARH